MIIAPPNPTRRRSSPTILLVCIVGLVLAGLALLAQPSVDPVTPPPSGVYLPAPDDGWALTFAENFAGDKVDQNRWTLYKGWSKSQPPSLWDPQQVDVADGVLTINGGFVGAQWLTGGLTSANAGSQRYGKWEVRFRVDAGDGDSYAILLYPEGGGWPPEIDIAEDAGGDRRSSTATLHYDSDNKNKQRTVSANFTQWQTIGVIWERGRLDFTLNGSVYGTVISSGVPDVPMWLGMQIGKKPCSAEYQNCPLGDRTRPVKLQVDWIARYERVESP